MLAPLSMQAEKRVFAKTSSLKKNAKSLHQVLEARQRLRSKQAETALRSATSEREWIGDNFDYNRPVPTNNHHNLTPKVIKKEASLVVIVLSARNHVEERDAIRKTWGKGQAVYFVVGGGNTILSDGDSKDVLDSIHPDSYRSLPHKLKFGIHWIVQNHPYLQWILKVDDDCLVRNVTKLQSSLPLRSQQGMTVVGQIQVKSPVQRKGPWAESPMYTQDTYPPWPKGSCGYLINRAVATYIAVHYDTLPCFQGEDSSLGIWLSHQHRHVQWYNSSYLVDHRKCKQDDWLVLGHQFAPAAINACWRAVTSAKQGPLPNLLDSSELMDLP